MDRPSEALTGGDLFSFLRTIVLRRPLVFGSIVCVIAGAFFAWSQSSLPIYRASVKVRVEDIAKKSPQLGHRGIPSGSNNTGEALTVLRSRTLLQQVVRPKSDAAPAGLGLTTWVTDEDASPLSKMMRNALGRGTSKFRIGVQARRLNDKAPRALRLQFVDLNTIQISDLQGERGGDWADGKAVERDFAPGVRLLYRGVVLDIDVLDGTPDDRSWHIELLDEEQAVSRVASRVRVDEQQRQPGTLGIVVTDDDPVRAAAIADAVAAAFVQSDLEKTRARADEKAAYIEDELTSRREELSRLFTLRSDLLVEYPDAVAPDAAAAELAEREGVWDDARRRARAQGLTGQVALEKLIAGESTRVALSGLHGGIPDEIQPLLNEINRSESELRSVGRGAADPGYRRTLLLKADDATLAGQALETHVMDLATVIAALERGDRAALARLGDASAGEGSIAVDIGSRPRLTQLQEEYAKRERLLLEFKPTAPPVEATDALIRHHEAALLNGLRAQLEGLESSRRGKMEHAAFWRDLYERYPDDEVRVLTASIAGLKSEAIEAFTTWVTGRRNEEERSEKERDAVRARQRGIAVAKRKLERTAPEIEQLERVAGDLLRDVENARIAAAGIEPSARIIDNASVPRRRLKPRASFGLAAGLFLGLLLALAWATITNDSQRRGSRSLMAEIAGADLGEVDTTESVNRPFVRLSTHGSPSGPSSSGDDLQPLWLPVLTDPDGSSAMGYRRLRARLTRARTSAGTPLRSIGVIATHRGDAASTVALNLALSRALGGDRVALIDGDFQAPNIEASLEHAGVGLSAPESPAPLRRPRPINPIFGPRRPGLAQVLSGSAPRAAAPTSIPSLDVLGPGVSLANSTDIFASAAFERFIAELEQHYDLVVIGLPPSPDSTDAEAAAHALGGIVLVSSMGGRSDAPGPSEIHQLIGDADGEIIGTVRATTASRERELLFPEAA